MRLPWLQAAWLVIAPCFFVPGLMNPDLIAQICQAVDLPINVMFKAVLKSAVWRGSVIAPARIHLRWPILRRVSRHLEFRLGADAFGATPAILFWSIRSFRGN